MRSWTSYAYFLGPYTRDSLIFLYGSLQKYWKLIDVFSSTFFGNFHGTLIVGLCLKNGVFFLFRYVELVSFLGYPFCFLMFWVGLWLQIQNIISYMVSFSIWFTLSFSRFVFGLFQSGYFYVVF